MKNILFVSENQELLEDLNMKVMFSYGSDMGFKLHCVEYAENLSQTVSSFKTELVVLDFPVLKKKDAWRFEGATVAFCAWNKEELEKGAEYGLPTYGILGEHPADELLEKLKKEPSLPEKKPSVEKQVPPGLKKNSTFDKMPPSDGKGKAAVAAKKADKGKKVPEKETVKEQAEKPEQKDSSFNMNLSSKERNLECLDEEDDYFSYGQDLDVKEDPKEEPSKEPDVPKAQTPEEASSANTADVVESGYNHDLGKDKKKTKVITVYSAKGGVGKTTIASELAVYLSLVQLGRRNLRVCIVDYNIDFGDVRNTLSVNASGPNLTYWSEELKELTSQGVEPGEIHYSRKEIEEHLVHMDKGIPLHKDKLDKGYGLYALPAPLTNEDSMLIDSDHLKIILSNIVEHGEFDYVVCDTGNNTRDSTMIALELADTILLVVTQDVNAANCDKAFMATMDSIDFDLTSKTKLVVNRIMPEKMTRISVQEVMDFFPYETVGKLKFNADVIKATNLGEPLAYQPGHDFTGQMREIVSFVLNNDEFATKEKAAKKGLFDKIFRRKG